MGRYKVIAKIAEEKVYIVTANDKEHALVRATMISPEAEWEWAKLISKKRTPVYECPGEWEEDKEFTIVGFNRKENILTQDIIVAPSYELAEEEYKHIYYDQLKDGLEILRIVEGRITIPSQEK